MRVLQISWEYPPTIQGGLARHVHRLSEQLAARGVEVHVLTRAGEDGAGVGPSARGVTVHRVRWPGAASFPRDMDAFLAWVEEMNRALGTAAGRLADTVGAELVHSHDWLVADAARRAARAPRRRPWLVTVHATEHGRHRGWVDRPPQSVVHGAERSMVREADHVIACSRWMRGHVVDALGADAGRVTAIPNGIDVGGERPAPEQVAAMRRRVAPDDRPVVALVGRLVHEKGFDLALRALASLVTDGTPVAVAVAGAGPADAELRALATELGIADAVTFLGWADDPLGRALYAAADVCVVPSRYEPFGIVALEAMAAGCPCVASDAGGLREVVPADGRAGLRVPAGDVDALAATLARVLGDAALRAALARGGRVHAATLNWSRVAAATERVYAELLG